MTQNASGKAQSMCVDLFPDSLIFNNLLLIESWHISNDKSVSKELLHIKSHHELIP